MVPSSRELTRALYLNSIWTCSPTGRVNSGIGTSDGMGSDVGTPMPLFALAVDARRGYGQQ